jgi:hypothetical protein
MNALDNIVENYLRFVFKWDENDKKDTDLDEYLDEDFKFSAVNNWEDGFDIVDWYEGRGDYAENGHYGCGRQGSLSDLLDFGETCDAIRIIQEFYSEYGGDSLMSYDDLAPEKVIRNYAYVFAFSKSSEEMKDGLLKPNWKES